MSSVNNKLPVSVFESHSKLDVETCDKFDKLAARVGIKAFRSEYEAIPTPAWKTIKSQMRRSKAVFLLVGPKLVEEQAKNGPAWKFTQNWIAYEVGLACALRLDVWVVCDGVEINFPVPYLNNYVIGTIKLTPDSWHRHILENYLAGKTYKFRAGGSFAISCPYKECGAKFNFYTKLNKEGRIICPTCLKPLHFKNGWHLE